MKKSLLVFSFILSSINLLHQYLARTLNKKEALYSGKPTLPTQTAYAQGVWIRPEIRALYYSRRWNKNLSPFLLDFTPTW